MVAHTTSPASNIMYALDTAYGYVDIARGSIIFTEFDVYPSMPQMYSSSDVVKLPPFQIDYSVTRQSSVTVQILTPYIPPTVVADVVSGEIRDADMLYSDFWDGRNNAGDYVSGGVYTVRVIAKDISTSLISLTTVQMTIDSYPLRIYDVAISPLTLDNPAIISYQVSETMKVAILIFKPGTTFDEAGMPNPPENISLVKRIIGVRPARTNISEYWDGTDLTLSRVPDGNYSFKIYGSTDTTGISSVTGAIKSGTTLADDMIVAEIPVVKTVIGDLCEEFKNNSFFYPNPYTGTSGKFKLFIPATGKVSLKIYNLAGDRVYTYDLGARDGDTNVEHAWARVNSSGKTVSSGVYIAVFRYESTDGSQNICQMTKKILIP
ncbi:MAG: hypothetical protein COT17_00825 [Elusimicrobia bacterium CG08_land_8_20_14_0_20_51_18]|nr:MAG: hypothetical protein COT17_00825 [Elusimicrobia bacterium CG08_land_8_20_14_0_20_51_18]